MRGLLWCGLFCALLLMAGQRALAETEPVVITLSCDGTVADTSSRDIPIDHTPKSIDKMGVVVNINERTVSFSGFVAPISSVDAASISFNGEQMGAAAQIGRQQGYTQRIDGALDRVTGHMVANTMTYKKSDSDAGFTGDRYDVLCKATNRVF